MVNHLPFFLFFNLKHAHTGSLLHRVSTEKLFKFHTLLITSNEEENYNTHILMIFKFKSPHYLSRKRDAELCIDGQHTPSTQKATYKVVKNKSRF